jgi:hypothetical protein
VNDRARPPAPGAAPERRAFGLLALDIPRCVLISLNVTVTGLRVRFTGIHRVATWSAGVDVPFARVVGSRVMTRADAVASSPRVPCPGAWWPGRLRVGAWGIGDRRQLWGARGGAYVVVVYLSGRPFHRLVVEVAEPRPTQSRIEAALLASKKTAARESLRGRLSELGDGGAAPGGHGQGDQPRP